MADPKLERVGSRHPEACQGTLGTGRCHYRAMPGSKFCALCGGGAASKANERSQLKNILLQGAYAQRAGELASSPNLKNLTDEVAITRLMLEGLLKNIKADTDFVIFSDKISTLVRSIQGLIESMQKIQEKNKELIDRQTLMAMTDGILNIIVNHIPDPDIQRKIGEEIYECIIRGMGEQV